MGGDDVASVPAVAGGNFFFPSPWTGLGCFSCVQCLQGIWWPSGVREVSGPALPEPHADGEASVGVVHCRLHFSH